MSASMNLPHHGGLGQAVPFPVHGANRGHLPDWHGPAGGHDQIWYSASPPGQPDTGHGSRHMAVEPGVRWVYYDIYDVLDYLVLQTGAPAEAALRTLQEFSAAALGRTIGLILMVTQVAVLCAQVFWSRPLAGGRAQVRKPGWANILLGFAFLLVNVEAGKQNGDKPVPPRWPLHPRQHDGLGRSCMPTLEEQFADALQREALSRPLSSGGVFPAEVHPSGPPVVPPVVAEEIVGVMEPDELHP